MAPLTAGVGGLGRDGRLRRLRRGGSTGSAGAGRLARGHRLGMPDRLGRTTFRSPDIERKSTRGPDVPTVSDRRPRPPSVRPANSEWRSPLQRGHLDRDVAGRRQLAHRR